MTYDELLRELSKFFLEEFSNDPEGVADWLAQGDLDPDEVFTAAKKAAQ